MEHGHGAGAALTIALALAAGTVGQSLARHLRVPGIVVLLLAGVLLGPDLAGIIEPASVRPALQALVGFAVAVILFEGGMNLNLRRLRREARVIRFLVGPGALITAAGGTAVARWILGWSWPQSALFGTLVIVTGPTVVTPLLRRFKIKHNLQTILEAEGVFIDAVGAIVAIVALQVVLQPSGSSLLFGIAGALSRFALGALFGLAGGTLIALLLRPRRIVPEGLENIFTLSFVLAIFQISNAVLPESGIATVTVAGVVVGNVRTRVSRDLLEFKEQLTVMFIGMLFVLLAADVRLQEVQNLGRRGILAVFALMLVVRPIDVLACTVRSSLGAREKTFLSWLAPRGIVAAAVASLFAQTLDAEGFAGGEELRAMVFLVIAVTVVVQGLTGGPLARLLGLRRPSDVGYAILGANDLGRALGRALSPDRSEITLIDSHADPTNAAEQEGFRVIFGNALLESTLARAQLDAKIGSIAVTTNEEINFLFAQHAREDFKVQRVYVGLQSDQGSITEQRVLEEGATILFGGERDLALWDIRFRRGLARTEIWVLNRSPRGAGGSGDREHPPESEAPQGSEQPPGNEAPRSSPRSSGGQTSRGEGELPGGDSSRDTGRRGGASPQSQTNGPTRPGGHPVAESTGHPDADAVPAKTTVEPSAEERKRGGFPELPDSLLALAVVRSGKRYPIDSEFTPKPGDVVYLAVFQEQREGAREWLAAHGWSPAPEETPDPSTPAEGVLR